MTIQISPEKLAEFENITLDRGAHPDESGHCAMEAVAWLAGDDHTDAPSCASRVLRRYTIALNDRWNDEQRQRLKPYLIRMIGTAGDGKDAARERIALAHLRELTAEWLNLAGIDSTRLTSATTAQETREALHAARTAAGRKRAETRGMLRAKARESVAEKFKARGEPTGLGVVTDVVDAVDDAVAAVAAVAIAAADVSDAVAAATDAAVEAVVAAATAADAGVAVAAVAVVAADAVAVAAATAAADAVDAEAAVALAVDAAVDVDAGGRYIAAHKAVRDYYRENPLPVIQAIAELAREQDEAALELLDRLITAEETK